MMRVYVQEDLEATMSKFLNGLRPETVEIVEFQCYLAMNELLDKAVKMKRCLKRRGNTLPNSNYQTENCRNSTLRSDEKSSVPSQSLKNYMM